MAKSRLLYSKKTKPWDYSFHVVVKQHHNKKIVYITYGGGRRFGGGAWSENLTNVHPRTMNMIKTYLGQKTVDEIEALLQQKTKGATNGKTQRHTNQTKERQSASSSGPAKNS
tara:strand:+ start:100 stop:438 length:339 start_codon:yes stop_codon:yes gene_type:complete